MSTVLINTNGGSFFSEGSDIISTGTDYGQGFSDLTKKFQLSLTNADNKPVLAPNRQVIDVVNDFSWYAGPKATDAALSKVPCVFLTEREQLLSSLLGGALYYLNNASKSLTSAANSGYVDSVLGKISKESGDILKRTRSKFTETMKGFQAVTGGTGADQLLLAQHNLKSLEGIYFTRPTGFQYRLPIYGSPETPTTEWSDGGESFVKNLIGGAQELVDNISEAVNFAQPGVYIEKPKYFNGPVGRTESVTFPLANTIRRGTVSPVQQNYELLWLLAFQNKPYKTSFSRTPPPKIYTVNVPGQFSMPYAFISGMKVDFKGTVRKTSVTVPAGNGTGNIGSKVIQTPVPEAYQVTLEFTSLIGDYGNTMLAEAFNTSIGVLPFKQLYR